MSFDKRIIAAIIVIAVCVVGFSVYFFVLRKTKTTKTVKKKPVTHTKTKTTVQENNTKYKEMYQECIKYFGKSIEKIVPYEWFVKGIKLKDLLKEMSGNISSFYLNISSSINNSNYTTEMYLDGYAYGPRSVIMTKLNPEKYALFYSKVTLLLVGPKGKYSKIMYLMMNNSTLTVCEKELEPIETNGVCGFEKIFENNTTSKFKLWSLLFYGYLLKNNMIEIHNTTKGTTVKITITKLPNISSNMTNITIERLPMIIYLNYTKSGLEQVIFIMNGVKMTFNPTNVTAKEILEKINNTIEEFKSSGAKFIKLNNTSLESVY